MERFAWMAWTWETALFFGVVACLLATMTVLALCRPEAERIGILRIPTTRGDRLFITLLLTAFINLAWLGLVNEDLYWALGISVLVGVGVFRFV
ncbi:MAG TPA: DUF2160 domain-containing protein [Ferrovibrio sp.]|uniref:DUF2160 domain-containing protein n=1 Tax=Ferrovibrio sp. TaxID=1917215 RepID=UPI002ED2A758